MILLTGAAGFIGSAMLGYLNKKGITDIVIVDKFEGADPIKLKNLEGKKYKTRVERDSIFSWLLANGDKITNVIHLGARTDTMEFDKAIFDKLNLDFSQSLFQFCAQYHLPIIYASSAATYGNGELGYSDRTEPSKLKPMNPYAASKNDFDIWVKEQEKDGDEWDLPPYWAGLKFFNVYGPNEYHKGRMASVIMHAFNQIKETGEMKLFRSHNPEFEDGEQQRDFIYVEDLCHVIFYLMKKQPMSGLFNLGTGKARSFLDLVKATFKAMGVEEKISFIDMPEQLRAGYQYFTEAEMETLRKAGYKDKFYSLEEGVTDYVQNYLMKDKAYK